MGFFVRPLCIQSGTSVALANKPQVLDPDEKALLITDFVVSLLLVTVGVLVILNLKYGVDLGSLSGLGSIGLDAAYAMIGIGGGIVGLDVLKLIIQQVRHINGLHNLANRAIPELIRELEEQEVVLENQTEQLRQQQQSNSRLRIELQELHEQAAGANRRVEEIDQQLQVALPLVEQVPQLNIRIRELDEQNQRLTQANAAIEGLSSQILELQRGKREAEEQKNLLEQQLQQAQELQQSLQHEGENQISQEQLTQLQEKPLQVKEMSISELKPIDKNSLSDKQGKAIEEALTFRPSNVNIPYDLHKLDFSPIQNDRKKKIHSTLNLKEMLTYKNTINKLHRLRDAVINEAKNLRKNLSEDHSVKLEALVQNTQTLKGYLERINKEVPIQYTNMFKK